MPAKIREQLPLAMTYSVNGHSGLRDAAASDNKSLPVHRWVPWIAGFSAGFVEDVIDSYLPRQRRSSHLVLDPFAGVGTTLVEALKAGCQTAGHEINPFAALAAQAKVDCIDANVRTFHRRIEDFYFALSAFERKVDRRWNEDGASGLAGIQTGGTRPEGFRSRIPFFSPPVEAKFLFALHQANLLREPYKALFKSALGAVMVSFSNYSYEPSLSSRPAAGKALIPNACVVDAIRQKLEMMCEDTALVQSLYGASWKHLERQVIPSSYFDSQLHSKSVSLLITSPPYMNNYHYVRNTRPQLYWLGLVSDSRMMQPLEQDNFGKFWQTVRNGEDVGLEMASRTLESKLKVLRTKSPERGQYGGQGWANYVATYFNDSDRFLCQAKRQLRPGGHAVVVVGNSIIQGIEFKVDELLAEAAQLRGFTVEDIRVVRKKRVGNSIIDSSVRNGNGNGTKHATQLYDAAVVLRS